MTTDQQVKFIKELGGVSVVASICGITRGAVSQWQKNGIPNEARRDKSDDFLRKMKCSFIS